MKYVVNMLKFHHVVEVAPGEEVVLTTAGGSAQWWGDGNRMVVKAPEFRVVAKYGTTTIRMGHKPAITVVIKALHNVQGEIAERAAKRNKNSREKFEEAVARLNERLSGGAKKSETETVEPDTQVYHSFMIEASDCLDLIDGRFIARPYRKPALPATANRFTGGVLSNKFPEMLETEHLVFDGGKLVDTHLVAARHWPMILVHMDQMEVEKAALAELAVLNGEKFEYQRPLDENSASFKVWEQILDSFLKRKLEGVAFNIGGTEFKFAVQSNAMAKSGKSRIWAVRSDLFDACMEAIRHGIDEQKMLDWNPVKYFFYRGLGLTGCAAVIPFGEMARFWQRAIVVKDTITVSKRAVLEVGEGGPGDIQYSVQEVESKEDDGCATAREVFFDFLHSKGLAADKWFCQSRAPYLKGMIAKGDLPTSGTVLDVYGIAHNWKDVDMVIPVSVFKGFPGYADWNAYLASEPAFGFLQPAANARTTNGQFLDTLMLEQGVHEKLGYNNVARFEEISQSIEDFNDEALWLGLKALAYEGLTPEAFAAADPDELASKIVSKVGDWQRGQRRKANTAHYVRPCSRNQYLLPDLSFILGGSDTLRAKGQDGAEYDEVCCLDLPEGLIVLSRNPICFAGEVVVVRNVHKAWGLHGCCHLAARSRLCAVLSGADFDGDQVFASADRALVKIVKNLQDKNICGVELFFNKEQLGIVATNKNIAWGVFAEMQNHVFEQAAQCGARSCEPSNKLGDFGWRWRLCAFFSVVMQVGVDAGKYGYVIPKKWAGYMSSFIAAGHRLPGWKYTKAADKETAKAVAQASKSATHRLKATHKDVTKLLLKQFALAETPCANGGYLVYDPRELIPSVVDGEVAKCVCTCFATNDIAAIVKMVGDIYKGIFARYGRKVVAGNAEDPCLTGDEIPDEEEEMYIPD